MSDPDPMLDALYRQVESLSDPHPASDDITVVLLVLADWYEERGERPAADCLRWCRKHGKRPWRASGQTPEFHWYDEDTVDRRLNTDPASDLPAPLFSRLLPNLPTLYQRYNVCRLAWTALFAAWPVAVGKGWDPNSYSPPDQEE